MGTTPPSLDARGQRDIRAAASVAFVLAGVGILYSLVIVGVAAAQYGVEAFRPELGTPIIFAGVGLLMSILSLLVGVAIARRSRLATLVAMVGMTLIGLADLKVLITGASNGNLLNAFYGAYGGLGMCFCLWVLVRAYRAISAAR